MKILMVCLGNICRSPAAEGIFRQKSTDWEIDSAGTGSWHVGNPPDKRSMDVCARNGIDISNLRARQVIASDGEYFDVILGMDRNNVDDLHMILDEKYHHKIKMIDKDEVLDPYFSPIDGFDVMFQHIETSAEEFMKKN